MTVLLFLKRGFISSNVLYRQPPEARRRLIRKNTPPFHKTATVWEYVKAADAEYPPIKPRLPDGAWGSVDPKIAWKRHELATQLSQIPSLYQKLEHLSLVEQNLWYHPIHLPFQDVSSLDFFQYITSTKLISGELPEKKPATTHEIVNSDYISSSAYHALQGLEWCKGSHSPLPPSKISHGNIVNFMENFVSRTLREPSTPEHLRMAHIDEGSHVECFIKRTGYEELGLAIEDRPRQGYNHLSDNPGLILSDVDRTIRDEDGFVKFSLRAPLTWSMRTHVPLKPFVEKDDAICYTGEIPRYNYHPEVLDIKPIEHGSFQCMPLHKTFHFSNFARNVAGYWCENPFYPGDPRSHSLLGVVNVDRIQNTLQVLHDTKGGFTLTPELLKQQVLAEGLLTAFTWCVAQAFNAGIHPYSELTHPICCQLFLTNGRDESHFLAYQLNSVTRLWKPDDASLPFNIAWYKDLSSPSVPFMTLKQSMSQLTDMLLSPVDAHYQYPMDQQRNQTDQWRDFIQPDPEEEAENRHRWRNPKPRVYNLPRPHPNRMFYFRPVEKTDLVKDLRSTVTKTKFAELPEPYESQARATRQHVKLQQRGREKTLKPPPKYQ